MSVDKEVLKEVEKEWEEAQKGESYEVINTIAQDHLKLQQEIVKHGFILGYLRGHQAGMKYSLKVLAGGGSDA